MYLVYLKHWTLNLMPLMVYPKVVLRPNLSIKGLTGPIWRCRQWPRLGKELRPDLSRNGQQQIHGKYVQHLLAFEISLSEGVPHRQVQRAPKLLAKSKDVCLELTPFPPDSMPPEVHRCRTNLVAVLSLNEQMPPHL